MELHRLVLLASLIGYSACRVHADEPVWSTFFEPSSFPNPDPKFKLIGDGYVYYQQQNLIWEPTIGAKGMFVQQFAGFEYELTDIRMAQPVATKGGTLSIWTIDVSNPSNPIPGLKLGEVKTSTTLHAEGVAVIQNWDFAGLDIKLAAGKSHFLVMDSPLSWYQGQLPLKASQKNGVWGPPFPADPIGPAFEVRGNKIPAPGGLAVVGLGGLACASRRRRR